MLQFAVSVCVSVCLCLQVLELRGPVFVKVGESVKMDCLFDMEGETLYRCESELQNQRTEFRNAVADFHQRSVEAMRGQMNAQLIQQRSMQQEMQRDSVERLEEQRRQMDNAYKFQSID